MQTTENALWQIYQNVYFNRVPTSKLTDKSILLLSVWNPNGLSKRYLANKRHSTFVTRYLKRIGLSYLTLWGGNACMTYREYTLAISNVNNKKSYRLAKLARQKAYYLIINKQLILVETKINGRRIKLRHARHYLTRMPKLISRQGVNYALAE